MSMVNLNIRIDNDVKKQFDEICENIGLSMSSAFNVFAKAVIRERGIPFELKEEDPFYSSENISFLEKSKKQMDEGKFVEKSFDEMKEYWG